jgi:hypothetical protein
MFQSTNKSWVRFVTLDHSGTPKAANEPAA